MCLIPLSYACYREVTRAEDLVNRLGWSSTSSKLQSTGRLNALRCGRFVEVVNATVCECVEDVPSDDPPAVWVNYDLEFRVTHSCRDWP